MLVSDSEIRSGREFEILSEGHVLVVRQATRSLQGLYTCRADSEAGSITASARLIVAENCEGMHVYLCCALVDNQRRYACQDSTIHT